MEISQHLVQIKSHVHLRHIVADHFLGALKEIERRAQNNILVFSDVLTERLEVIAQNMVGKSISDNDYLKLLELYYKKFSKDENKQAMLFCLLRMQEVVFYKEHKDTQKDLNKMEFNEEYDSITKVFLSRKRDYYQITLKNIFQRFILLDTLAYIVFLLMFVLLIHIPFRVSFILLVILWILVLFFAKKKGVPYFYDSRIQTLLKDVDVILLKIDQSIFSKVE